MKEPQPAEHASFSMMLDDAVFDLQTLHVLAANIRMKSTSGDKRLCAAQVSNSLNLPESAEPQSRYLHHNQW